MNSSKSSFTFFKQLKYWAGYCGINALPCLIVGILFEELWRSNQALLGLFCGILTFTIICATIGSWVRPLSDEKNILRRALKLALKIRFLISGFGFLLGFSPIVFANLPRGFGILDYWAWETAGKMVNRGAQAARWSQPHTRFFRGYESGFEEFVPTYLVTVSVGLILSIFVATIAFFAVIFLQARDRRKRFKSEFRGAREKA